MKTTTPLLPLLSLIPATKALKWQFDATSATCDGSPFVTPTLTITCTDPDAYYHNDPTSYSYQKEDTSKCTLGSLAEISGNVTAVTSFDSTSYVILQPCLIFNEDYSYCPSKYSYKGGGICDEWLSPSNNNEWMECGEAGDYTLDYSVKIPNTLPEYLSWLGISSELVTVKVMVLQEQQCTVDVYQYSEGYYGYRMGYGVLGFGAGLVCAGAAVRRRRRMAEECSDEEEKEGVGGDYIEMLAGTNSSDGGVGSAAVV